MSKEMKIRKWLGKQDRIVSTLDVDKYLDIIYIENNDALANQEIKEIARHFGLEHQMKKLEEELIELLHAVSRYNTRDEHDYNDDELLDDIIEELGDVKMVMKQIIYLLDVKKEVSESIEDKILRTFRKMPCPEGKELPDAD